jgi:hypothetical protein
MKKGILATALTVAISGLAACSTASRHAPGDSPLDHAVDLALAEMRDAERLPASDGDLGATIRPDFKGLRRELKVVVLPKVSNQTEKTRAPLTERYGEPLVYTFHARRLVACKSLVGEKINGSPHAELFAPNGAAAPAGDCAILEVKRTRPELRPAQYRHDVISETLYLDSSYRAYGLDTRIGHDRKDIERATLRLSPGEALSSGLSLFPVDLPSPAQVSRARRVPAQLPPEVLADEAARAHLSREGAQLGCGEGFEINYRDAFGSPVRVLWCAGARWPSLVETRRFLAVVSK